MITCHCACELSPDETTVISPCGLHVTMKRVAYNNAVADTRQQWDRVVLQLKMNPSTASIDDVVAQIRILQKVAGLP